MNPGKYCNVCGERKTITTRKTRMSWKEYPYCRICRYHLEIFSGNGNYLKEYW